ncbi:MAG: class I SAM-dependent methyltransferase [Phycisphaerales bacterium]|nr:class I SAM-dependent methyltransferase [Phycisphaerales bacterium]
MTIRDYKVEALRERIVALYGPKILRRSAINIRGGAGAFAWAMAGHGYRTAVEIGTYRGISAAAMSLYCERVVTIDLAQGKLERNGEAWDREAFWRSLGINNVEMRAVRDDAEKAATLRGLAFDFAFVDGAHDRTVANDFAMVGRCGNVLFHDADDTPGDNNCVFEFLSTLPRDHLQFHDIFALWTA